jgi:ribosomal protein L37E
MPRSMRVRGSRLHSNVRKGWALSISGDAVNPNTEIVCPHCGSANYHEHDTYCDDEHGEDNCCFPF